MHLDVWMRCSTGVAGERGLTARRQVRLSEKGEVTPPKPAEAAAGGAPGCCPTAFSCSRLLRGPLARLSRDLRVDMIENCECYFKSRVGCSVPQMPVQHPTISHTALKITEVAIYFCSNTTH